MKEELLKMADRVEALSGPDWEVDKLIAVLNGWCLHPWSRQRDDSAQSDTGYTCLDCGADSWGNTGPTGQKRSASLPTYTASLDAAMTLVPKGWAWSVLDRRTTGYSKPNGQCWTKEDRSTLHGDAATPALALCAAALRALAKEK